MKEAVRLFEGTRGLERLALEEGRRFPSAFVEWLEALQNENQMEEMVRAARLGLETVPETLQIRATIADYLKAAARRLKRPDLILLSLQEALYADPSLARLLDLLEQAQDAKQKDEFLREARTGGEIPSAPDLAQSFASRTLVVCCHILRADYAAVASLVASSKPLGWSYSDNPNALAKGYGHVRNADDADDADAQGGAPQPTKPSTGFS